jgi:hypothetical protein
MQKESNMKTKFKDNDIVRTKYGDTGKVVSVKWSCCSDTIYKIKLRNGKIVSYREHELNYMVETK